MEPAFIDKMDNSEDRLQRNDDMEEVNPNTISAIDELKAGIIQLKKQMFFNIVSNDTSHIASDKGAMMSFHALFLQCIGYWIGMLDSTNIPKPVFVDKKTTRDFDALTNAIKIIKESSIDAKVLLYSMLFMISNKHPFDLGNQKRED